MQAHRGLLLRNIQAAIGQHALAALTPSVVRDWYSKLAVTAGGDQAAKSYRLLRAHHFCRVVGFPEPPDRGARLHLFCGADGLDDSLDLLDKMEACEHDGLHEMLELGGAGVSPFNRFLTRGEDRFPARGSHVCVAHRRELERALE